MIYSATDLEVIRKLYNAHWVGVVEKLLYYAFHKNGDRDNVI